MPRRPISSTFRRTATNSKKKRATQFKKGRKLLHNEGASGSNPQPKDQVIDNFGQQSDPDSLCNSIRLPAQQAQHVMEIMTNNSKEPVCDNNGVRLRPKRDCASKTLDDEDVDENIIININNLTKLVNLVHKMPHCRTGTIQIDITKRKGLCIHLSLKCNVCSLFTPAMAMSDEIATDKGPSAGALNSLAVLPILKSKVGIEDTANMLSCLNIRCPSKRLLQNKLNTISTLAIRLNEQQMRENQEYSKTVHLLAGVEAATDVQIDCAYASRLKGDCDGGTQSVATLIDHSISQPLPLAIATANKNCRIPGCSHNIARCTKNYQSGRTMASCERTLLQDTLQQIDDANILALKSITTDDSSQEAKAIRDYYNDKDRTVVLHYLCFIHRLRTLRKHIKKLQLKSIPKKYNKKKYTCQLATCIRDRVRQELVYLKARQTPQPQLIRHGAAATENITKCFSGHHENCRTVSSLCKAHIPEHEYNTNHLPYNSELELSNQDILAIQNKIDHYFGVAGLSEMPYLYNTNMCESLNGSIFNVAPKTSHWSRNFPAMAHSATHSWTRGRGLSTIQLAREAGITVKTNSELYIKMKQKDLKRAYFSKRQKTLKCKRARFYNRKRKSNESLYTDSLYSKDNSGTTNKEDHNYGFS